MESPKPTARLASVTPISQSVTAPLRVVEILTSTLPLSLGTAEAPERYTVTAVLSRRVDPFEAVALHHPFSLKALHDAGYRDVRLTVADRRLLIENTTLAELRSGLAESVGRLLREASTSVTEKRTAAAEDLARISAAEEVRAEAIRAEAASIRF